MSDGVIYQCIKGCTVALDDELLIPDRVILLPVARLAMPECEDCSDRMDYPAVLSPEDDPSTVTTLCKFCRVSRSHRNLIPSKHVCTCTLQGSVGDVPGPAHQMTPAGCPHIDTVVQAPIEEAPESMRTPSIPGTPWADTEIDVVKVCSSADEACTRYADAYPGRRNSNAVTQKWQKLQKRGELLRVGGACVISKTSSANAGAAARVISFCDGKRAANVEVAGGALATYQYDVHMLTGTL